MSRTFRYKDGQVYETDQETLDLMKRLHALETDPKMVEAHAAIRTWEPQAHERSLSDVVFEVGTENGRIHAVGQQHAVHLSLDDEHGISL